MCNFRAMNYLAHIYLSGDEDPVKIGNFIADSIHGKRYQQYPASIQRGILLHRAIDTFTDAHPVFRQSTAKLHKKYSHYSGVIVDIFYDHFLAKNWANYSPVPLALYAANFYNLLQKNESLLPEATKRMLPYMIANDWLSSYATQEGISKALEGMNRRTQNRSRMNEAITQLNQYYTTFEAEFTLFFNEVISFSNHTLSNL